MEPISLNNCHDIKVTGITIDYKRRPFSTGKIVDVQHNYYDVVFEKQYPMNSTMSLLRVTFFDTKAYRLLGFEQYQPDFRIIAPQKLRIFKSIDPSMVGNRITASHGFHFRPAVLIQEAEQITLQDVTIHAQPGMGILGFGSKDIFLQGVRVVPAAQGALFF